MTPPLPDSFQTERTVHSSLVLLYFASFLFFLSFSLLLVWLVPIVERTQLSIITVVRPNDRQGAVGLHKTACVHCVFALTSSRCCPRAYNFFVPAPREKSSRSFTGLSSVNDTEPTSWLGSTLRHTFRVPRENVSHRER